MRRVLSYTFICFAIVFTPTVGFAWWDTGHRIVADIAEQRLTPAAADVASKLLALDGKRHLAEIASWADDIRRDRKETYNWHFVDIPLEATAYDTQRDCKNDDCVVAQIDRFTHVLADRAADPAARLEALKFVVHFVGDIHQPLHCEDHADRGGNDVHVKWFGQPKNLHMVWDGLIIERMGDLPALETKLESSISENEAQKWAATGASDWANEGHEIARQIAYGALPEGTVPQLDAKYLEIAVPIIEIQLERAGVRLAHVLNEALR